MKEAQLKDKHTTPHTVLSCQILSYSAWLHLPLGQQMQKLHIPDFFKIRLSIRLILELAIFLHQSLREKLMQAHYLSIKVTACVLEKDALIFSYSYLKIHYIIVLTGYLKLCHLCLPLLHVLNKNSINTNT